MNALSDVIAEIESYPDKDIPLPHLCKMVGVKRNTIANQVRHNIIPSRFDGYRHNLSKDTAKDIATKHKSAILGWIRQKEIMKEFSVGHQSLYHICKSRNLVNEQDYCGFVRLPPETVLALREMLPQYLAKEIMQHDDRLYYSITKLAYDMAKKIEKDYRLARFRYEEERIYKCLHNWCQRKLIQHIFVPGKINIYVPDFIYDNLIALVRIKDSAYLCGMTRRTIYNWIELGLLPKSKSPSGSTLINIKDLDDTLILKMQISLMRKHASDPEMASQISDFGSLFWSKKITSLRTLGGDFTKTNNCFNLGSKDRYLQEIDGYDKLKIRAIRAVGKRRKKTAGTSLDEEMGEDSNSALIDCIADESVAPPDVSAEATDILSLVNTLEKDDCELICKLFGMGDYEITSMSKLSEEKGIPIVDLQSKVDGILSRLKEKLV